MNEALNAVRRAIERRLRSPRASRLLQRLGIEPRRYWLLMDLFATLSERGEMLDQLGMSGVALGTVGRLYFAMSTLLSFLFVVVQPPLVIYFVTFQLLSAFLLLGILLSEVGNSLVNPVEALVLAHQPINGATYTTAKLSHLMRIILYLVPGLNAVPALAGLTLARSRWFYPFLHMGAALAVALVISLLCCALFGWLIRFLPTKRLKGAGQLAGAAPLICVMWLDPIRRFLSHLHPDRWLPAQPSARWGLATVCAVAVSAAVVLGLRSLSADYLLRVSDLVHDGAAARSRPRRSRLAAVAARCFGGQPARAGFLFVSRMMFRDWQFRRQLIPMLLPVILAVAGLFWKNGRIDPFSAQFTPMHLFPHLNGMVLFVVCNILAYGNDYKGAWIFQLAPSRAFDGFAAGVFAVLWIEVAVLSHAILLALVVWLWGVWHAALFVAFSLAASSLYLALEIRRIDGAPFSKPVDPSRGPFSIAILMGGGFVAVIAMGLQYALLFRWPVLLLAVTIALAVAAYCAARSSIPAFALVIRHNLATVSGETGALYKEIVV